jgi:hypothetical protein
MTTCQSDKTDAKCDRAERKAKEQQPRKDEAEASAKGKNGADTPHSG